jgi:hypothetical protein
VGDDRTSTGHDGCRQNMLVVGVGQTVGTLQPLPAVDFSVLEGGTHLGHQVERSPGGLIGCLAALDQLGGLVVLELLEDGCAPHRAVHASIASDSRR